MTLLGAEQTTSLLVVMIFVLETSWMCGRGHSQRKSQISVTFHSVWVLIDESEVAWKMWALREREGKDIC